ncbi:MAG: DNA-processing protein DprA, partial [Candidatus Omnitrophota bacterium]
LKAKGRTIAVMGSGFRHIYPRGAEKLFSEIVESGAVLTEYVSETHPAKWNFPKRNRIISGMSKGVVVVEAARKSGAMITMNFALEQGREVFAVPGRVDSHTSGGTNKLIQEGAKLVTGVEDILEELNIEKNVIPNHKTQREKKKGKKALNEQQQRVLTTISGKNSIHIDQIYNLTKIKFQHLSGILLNLELKGLIRQLPGRSYHAG